MHNKDKLDISQIFGTLVLAYLLTLYFTASIEILTGFAIKGIQIHNEARIKK